VIEIKNTTKNNAKVLLTENLPLSNDESLKVRIYSHETFHWLFSLDFFSNKVKLIEPKLDKNQVGPNCKLNKANNLEYTLNIQATKTEEVTIKYTIEHPSDKETEFF